MILALAVMAGSAFAYNPIIPTKSGETVTLNGRSLTIEQVVDVARHGAKVRLTNGARQLRGCLRAAARGSPAGHPDLLLQPRHRVGA
jgi:hypothetical protein